MSHQSLFILTVLGVLAAFAVRPVLMRSGLPV